MTIVTLENAVEEIGESVLGQIEIDTFKITDRCPRACSHCSQSPDIGLSVVSLEDFGKYVKAIAKLKEETGNDLLTNYLLTSTDSDPFLHPQLADVVQALHEATRKRFYLLTSGWYVRSRFQMNADWIAKHPGLVERVSLTLSNFPTNPSSVYENMEILVNVVRTFGRMPEDKFAISPQYNAEVGDENIHSEKQIADLLDYVLKRAGFSRTSFEGRIFFRPVIGLGRASALLGVKKQATYRIEAEDPLPVISTRETERPYSGLVDMQGNLLVMEAPRAILNRKLGSYEPASTLRQSPS